MQDFQVFGPCSFALSATHAKLEDNKIVMNVNQGSLNPKNICMASGECVQSDRTHPEALLIFIKGTERRAEGSCNNKKYAQTLVCACTRT